MSRFMRSNGSRDMSTKEYRVFERLVKAGHRDVHIAEMLGRVEKSVRGLREYYGLTDPEKYKRTGAKFSPEEDAIINQKIRDWVETERLTSKQMAKRLAYQHPPGLHWATVCTRINKMGKDTRLEHKKNVAARKSAQLSRRHMKGGCRTQPRDAGKFTSRRKDATEHTEDSRV